ncbi:FAD-dependent oxidoreductase [Pseudooceanicola sp.]|uniref:dihydrolipoyl dehydrogenase family protein n=1 Tax=Pseudooceanicola sp. TaxID=1914328 RepID=UPI002607573D|nr:FAD-dependent oxidoreductase [Pseudooceanicola sp.]MDF1856954.1 FAD-dependent oxidoreductase [Pseudooceanicola sp.]
MRFDYDLLVVGAGSGGLSVASGAAQMGARVALAERGEMGGDCLNYGCVPSKALIAAGARAQAMRDCADFGITPVVPEVDYAAVMDHVAATIAKIAPHDSQERFEGFGIEVIRDHARFTGPQQVQVGDRVIRARRVVIATGASPLVPPIDGLDGVPYLTNETLFDLRERPDHLLVLGGGPIGMEMAQAHVRLGCKVTVIEADRALNRDDPEMAAVVLARLHAEGIEIAEGARAAQISGKAGAIRVLAEDGRVFEGSHLLVALGRRPNIADLGLEAAGIATERGAITVDARLRTSNKKVFAIGDVTGGLQFTHLAGYEAGVVIRAALFGLPAKARHDHIPRATYTEPELAQVGLTEAEARGKHGDALQVVAADYSGNDRALASLRSEGGVKVMVVKGRPVGATIVGAEAGELISLWALALSKGLKLSDIAGMVAPYPTLSELAKRAAGAYFSPKLFENPWVKRAVAAVQRVLP